MWKEKLKENRFKLHYISRKIGRFIQRNLEVILQILRDFYLTRLMENTYYTPPAWVEPILIPNEYVAWEGKPLFVPFLFTHFDRWSKGLYLLFSLVMLWFFCKYALGFGLDFNKFNQNGLATAIILFLVLPSVYILIKRALEFKNVHYCITNRRVITYTGMFSKTYTDIEFSDLLEMEIMKTKFDRKYNSGTILFRNEPTEYDTKGNPVLPPCMFESVGKPYHLIKLTPEDKVKY
jgi:hypothetical protein